MNRYQSADICMNGASNPRKVASALVDGNGNDLFTKSIDYTDCPEGEWKFFFTGNVLMLPSEYWP